MRGDTTVFVWILEGHVLDDHRVRCHLEQWVDAFGSSDGYVGAVGGVTADHRFIFFVLWESESAGDHLLLHPEPHKWYESFQECFEDRTVAFSETSSVSVPLLGRIDETQFMIVNRRVGVEQGRAEAASTLARPIDREALGCLEVSPDADTVLDATLYPFVPSIRGEPAKSGEADLTDVEAVEHFSVRQPFRHVAGGRRSSGAYPALWWAVLDDLGQQAGPAR
jgi:hypothetical protein